MLSEQGRSLMKSDKVVLTDLERLLVSDRETGGKPVLPQGGRPRVQKELEQIVVTWERLHDHVRALSRHVGRDLRHRDLLPEDLHDAVVREGLAILDDPGLAKLAL